MNVNLWEKNSGLKKVSVVVPNYNYGRYLKKRVQTILEQTYPIYELLILDDCSTDGSKKLAKEIVLDLKVKYPEMNVKFVPNEKNSGKTMKAWKKGWELATGDYIWIAEVDDLCKREFLAEAMKGFDDPEVVLSYTESMIINGLGLMVAPNFRWSRDKERTGHYKQSYVKDGRAETKEIMAVRCTIPNVSGVVMRHDKKFLKYLEEALKYSQVGDWYFYTKILEHGKISYNRKALNKFRIHGGSVTGKSKQGRKHYTEVVEMHEYFRENYDLTPEVLERMMNEQKRIRGRAIK